MGGTTIHPRQQLKYKMWLSSFGAGSLCILSAFMVAFVPITNAQKVVHIQVKTADEPEAGMSLASVDVELQNQEGNTCIITNLNSDTLFDFSPGGYNTYEGETLEDCLDFYVGPDHIIQVNVTHSGFDNWKPEWFRVLLDD